MTKASTPLFLLMLQLSEPDQVALVETLFNQLSLAEQELFLRRVLARRPDHHTEGET